MSSSVSAAAWFPPSSPTVKPAASKTFTTTVTKIAKPSADYRQCLNRWRRANPRLLFVHELVAQRFPPPRRYPGEPNKTS